MKHFISILAVIMSAIIFCSCNTDISSVVTDNTQEKIETIQTISTEQNMITQALEEPTESPLVTIEETLIIDESGIKITAKSLDFSSLPDPALNILIENNSGSNLTFQCRNVSVNGYMIDALMSENVSNGKKSNASIKFEKESLETCNISTIADIEFNFTAFSLDIEERDLRYLENTKVTLKTSAAASYEYKFDDSGDLIYDNNGIRIVAKGIAKKYDQTRIVVYIENNTEMDLTVQVRNTSINGFMIDPTFSPKVSSGKHLIGFISFDDSELAKNDIDEIKEVETSFRFFEIGEGLSGFNTEILKIKF